MYFFSYAKGELPELL